MLTLVTARSDGTLGPKVKPWSGTCPSVMPLLYLQAPRRPLVNGPPPEADDRAVVECPTGYRAGGILVDGATMQTVAQMLSLPPARALLGTIVDDQTGLSGRYTMELDYPFPQQSPANSAAAGFRPSLPVHRCSGAMGAAAGQGEGAVQARRGRKRADADARLRQPWPGNHLTAEPRTIVSRNKGLKDRLQPGISITARVAISHPAVCERRGDGPAHATR